MRQLIFLFSAAIVFSFPAHAQSGPGYPAPRLDLRCIMQEGEHASLDSLHGKFVLVEFWATWCTPCVRNIPHLNELQEKFKDRNIQFVSVTDEPKEKIELFLQKRKMNGWIGIDDKGQTFKNYKVSGRPVTFIINDKGMIVFRGEPSAVTEDVLNNLLSGNKAAPRNPDEQVANKLGGFGGGEDPVITANFNMRKMGYLHQEVIRPAIQANMGAGWKSDHGNVGISVIGANITHALAYIIPLPTYVRIINRSSVPDTANWDIIFSRNKGYDLDKARKELYDVVCKTFSVAMKDTEVMKEVLVPHYSGSAKLIYSKGVKEDDPQLKTYQLLSDIFEAIEKKTGTIVIYPADTGDIYLDVFDLGNKYYSMDGAALKEWLRSQGVNFTTENRQVKLKVLYNME